MEKDISDQKTINQLLERLTKTQEQQKKTQGILEKIVIERTKELEEHKEMYRTLSRVSPVGIFRSNESGDFVYVNQKWLDLTGLPKKQCLGKGWLQAIYEIDRGKIYERWRDCVNNGDSFSNECRFITPNGKITWVLIQANLVNGDISQGHVGSVTNITNKKVIIPELVALRDSIKVQID